MDAWQGLFVPEQVLSNLESMGFSEPTNIQRLVLPSAIRDRRDILGAAETGSGKTLAFGIPVIQKILELKAHEEAKQAVAQRGTSDPMEVDTSDDDNINSEEDDGDDFDQPPDEEDLLYTWKDDEIQPDLSLIIEEIQEPQKNSEKEKSKKNSASKEDRDCLYCVILTPTRELAVQVKNHIEAAACNTGIKIGIVIGGMSPQKQERILSKRPEIVVATPGRFWDFVQSGHIHLRNAAAVPLLVLDEADRLLESGHFAEVRSFLDRVRVTPVTLGPKKRRQTFVFSATLTFIHAAPKRKLKNQMKANRQLSEQDRVDFFMNALGLTERRPRIVDCTQRVVTLTETYLQNSGHPAERDSHLMWLLRCNPGRTLVFCNSKNTSRRLVSVFRLLRCRNPLGLHADMHQKARLKNLERFAADPDGLLIASDVAARGLDIPHVQHVIHYQAPKTAETYVHRSGRTARANRDGQSVVLLGPEEIPNFRRMMWNMKRDVEGLQPLTPKSEELSQLRRVVDLARDLEATEHQESRSRGNEEWFVRAAREADLLLDSGSDSEEESTARAKQASRQRQVAAVQGMRRGLAKLLEDLEKPSSSAVAVNNRLGTARCPQLASAVLLPAADDAEEKKAKKGKKRKKKKLQQVRGKAVTTGKDRNSDANDVPPSPKSRTILKGKKKCAKRLVNKSGFILKKGMTESV